MQGLRERALIEPLRRYAASGRPLLGICLGMQMLATVSEEFGLHGGLGLIPGRVVPVPSTTTEGLPHKIPLIGWSGLMPAEGAVWSESVLRDTAASTPVYLVHSYHLIPDDSAHVLAYCMYGGHRITTAVCRGPVTGCQFHPEKSGEAGLAILARFLQS
jgi:glutamine amidotransferase